MKTVKKTKVRFIAKSTVIAVFLSLVAIIALAACSPDEEDSSNNVPEGLTPLEAYSIWVSELTEVSEFQFTNSVTVKELSTETYVSSHFIEGYASRENETMQIAYHAVPVGDMPLSGAEPDMEIVVSDGYAYADLTRWAQNGIRQTLELMEADFTNAYVEELTAELLGDATLVREPFPYPIDSVTVFRSFFDFLSEEELSRYLSYENGTFTLLIDGNSFLDHVDSVLGFILHYGGIELPNVFLHYGIERQSETMGLMEWFIAENADFSEAEIRWSQSRTGDNFAAEIEVIIPGWLSAQKSITLSPGLIPPITQPQGQRVSMQFFSESLDDASWILILGDGDGSIPGLPPMQTLDLEVVYDLADLTIVGHDLTNNHYLDSRVLTNSEGEEFLVPVFSGDFFEEIEQSFVMQESTGVQLLYMISSFDGDIVNIADGTAQFFTVGEGVEIGSLRVSEDEQSATLIVTETSGTNPRTFALLFELLPDAEHVVTLVVTFSRWEMPDDVTLPALVELGELIGMDFTAPLLGRSPLF